VPFEDPGEHEPDPEPDVEPDPEADLTDYEQELTSIPEPPEPDADTADAPDGLVFTFWWLVIVFNVSLLALSIGVLFVVVAGQVRTGLNFLFVGGVLGAYGCYRYWTSPYRDGLPEDVDATSDDAGDDDRGASRADDERAGADTPEN